MAFFFTSTTDTILIRISNNSLRNIKPRSKTNTKHVPIYNQTCIKTSSLGQSKSGLLRQVTS